MVSRNVRSCRLAAVLLTDSRVTEAQWKKSYSSTTIGKVQVSTSVTEACSEETVAERWEKMLEQQTAFTTDVTLSLKLVLNKIHSTAVC